MKKTLLALNTDLSATVSDGKAPDWVELIPSGPMVSGRDGRQWLFDDQAGVLVRSNFDSRSIDLPIDWEHATQHRAAKGEEAPASGWIKQLDIRAGALWGLVDWTPRGSDQVGSREYRFLSPVFDYDPDTSRIVRLVSAGLTNTPNFYLTALNQENQEIQPVTLPAALLIALGLSDAATEEQAIAAATQLKTTAQAANSEQPNLAQFVPRGDYDALLLRAANAEQAVAEHKQAEHSKEVEAVLAEATKAGKIVPATLEYHRASCKDADGLQRLKDFIAAAPAVGNPSGLGERKPDGTVTALNAEEQKVAKLLGMSEADFIKGKA
ncbi:Mu-like prophage I protein [Pseudomonas asplenii]|uniref:Mu-like prophage I protein n=1 Tax=Pseudomonas asplenii TaxID=53407 RepID=A0A0N0VJK4_9PSED|nr:phage protease [Pseudomonas fuscovaginae]KPA90612.1 Mu-like prophage I protein [Pseudomonas fuscovaginae]